MYSFQNVWRSLKTNVYGKDCLVQYTSVILCDDCEYKMLQTIVTYKGGAIYYFVGFQLLFLHWSYTSSFHSSKDK